MSPIGILNKIQEFINPDKNNVKTLPQKYDDIIFALTSINDKLILGGSLGLYVMGVIDYDFKNRKPDIDFSLTEPLTEEELLTLKDFFNLELVVTHGDYDFTPVSVNDGESVLKTKPISHFITKELIQLRKNSTEWVTPSGDSGYIEYTIDFFNSQYIKKRDIIYVDYNGIKLKVNHPSITLSHKSRYAYDNRVGKQYKHFKDIGDINWKKYFQIVKSIKSQWVENDGNGTWFNEFS
jgi:hypothetical protein